MQVLNPVAAVSGLRNTFTPILVRVTRTRRMVRQGAAAVAAVWGLRIINCIASVGLVVGVLAGFAALSWRAYHHRLETLPDAITWLGVAGIVLAASAAGLAAMWIGARHLSRLEVCLRRLRISARQSQRSIRHFRPATAAWLVIGMSLCRAFLEFARPRGYHRAEEVSSDGLA